MANSWRSTTISNSLESADRNRSETSCRIRWRATEMTDRSTASPLRKGCYFTHIDLTHPTRYRVSEVVVEEVAQAPGRLEPGHVGVQIDPVDTPDLQRDVVTDNVGDVGRHRDLLGRSPMKVLPVGARRACTRSQHRSCPNGRAAAAIRGIADVTKERRSRRLYHVSTEPRSCLAV